MLCELRTIILALGAMAALLVGRAAAQDAQDAQGSSEARALIERQLDAFSRDDAVAAYAEAAPAIKAIFPDADTFMAMVRNGYTPVYRHRSVEFGPAKRDGNTIEQEATFVDQDGQAWEALYQLTRQPDGTWLISACSLLKLGGSV
jgi:hypothetical protein